MNEGLNQKDVCVEQPGLTAIGNYPHYDIKLFKAENGFIVMVGCKTFIFAEWSLASEALGLYFTSPSEAMKKYCRQ